MNEDNLNNKYLKSKRTWIWVVLFVFLISFIVIFVNILFECNNLIYYRKFCDMKIQGNIDHQYDYVSGKKPTCRFKTNYIINLKQYSLEDILPCHYLKKSKCLIYYNKINPQISTYEYYYRGENLNNKIIVEFIIFIVIYILYLLLKTTHKNLSLIEFMNSNHHKKMIIDENSLLMRLSNYLDNKLFK